MGIVVKHMGKEIGDPPTRVLADINLEIRDGEFVALTGRSGSGKSTLLYLLSSLDSPSEGVVELDGHDLMSMPAEELHRFRNQHMGFVFQFHYLLAELTSLENVLMPARKFEQHLERRARAEHLLEAFGLKEKMNRLPRQLSGGEQQRVAIARALVMEPRYLFADEPTGSLDTINGESVMNLIREANRERGTTVVMVTHDPDFARLAERQILLADGRQVDPSL
jgi:putative ABC transport system ATP-binding protein/lipoprotein-releasing system ATP-binding protein